MRDAIYGLQWYEWKTAEQKDLILVLGILERSPRFVAVTEKLTLMWFAEFLKASYSAGAILAELN